MDDLISRQAAIDALDEQIRQCDKALSAFDISMKDAYAVKVERASLVAFREILEYLPPAQLGTNLAEVGTDCISRQQAICALSTITMYKGSIPYDTAVMRIEQLPSAQLQLEECPIYGGMCGYPSNLCYECPRHEGAKERPQWWTEGLQPFAQPRHYHEENLLTYAHDMGVTLEQAKKELTMVSQIAPQRIKGRWVRKESDLSWWYECSECGESPLFDPYEHEVRTPFCPWCGAMMEEEEDG